AWADKQVRRWHKRDYQSPVIESARLIEAARKRDWSRLAAMLDYLGRKDRDEIFAASLTRLLANCDDMRRIGVLTELLHDGSPLVRAAAVDALTPHITAQTLPALKALASDSYRLVRVRAGAALAAVRDTQTEPAVAEYIASLQTRPDDYSQHMNLGVLYAGRGQLQEAVFEYETAIRLRPGFAPPLVNASVAYSRLGQDDKAEAALRRAIEIDPRNGAANLNLGLLLAGRQQFPQAERALRRALQADPANAVAAYNLSVILSRDRLDEAIQFARRASKSRPDVPRYAEALQYYETTRK